MLPKELPFKWRHSPDSPITVTAAAFARLVAENKLEWVEVDGYLWAWLHTQDGYDCYRAYGPKWRYVYAARRVATQANVAAGAIKIDVSVPTGMVAQMITAYGVNGGTNSLVAQITDEDNARHLLMGSAGSAAGSYITLPNQGTGTTIAETATTILISPGCKLSFEEGGAGAQNDTLTVAVTLLLPISAASDGSDITWSVARSTNPGDVTLAASTISAANTMQAVLLP